LEPQFLGEELGYGEYIRAIDRAKIGLAVSGHGPFTFRHLEILALGTFLLCSDEIREISLPVPLIEGEHYVAYSDEADLLSKIEWYLSHPDEREMIAENGKAVFFKYYDPCVHGGFIRAKIRESVC
jgi:spore maturation protein CgeB